MRDSSFPKQMYNKIFKKVDLPVADGPLPVVLGKVCGFTALDVPNSLLFDACTNVPSDCLVVERLVIRVQDTVRFHFLPSFAPIKFSP